MKGVSLSIRAVVIIILAVIVLVAVVVFFTGITNPNIRQVSDYDAWQRGCSKVKLKGCLDEDYDGSVEIENYDGTLADACEAVFGYTSAQDCKEECCGR